MKRTAALDAASTLGRMFGAGADRVAELASWIERQMSCESCLADAVAELLKRLERFPAPKQVLAAYLDVNQTAAHAAHMTTSARQVEVGRIEAFWRQEAPRLIAAHVDTDALASWIAAEMWASGTVEATSDAVVAELDEGRSVFVITARSRSAKSGDPTPEQVGEMFWAARQAATIPLIELDEATWNDRVERIGQAMSWGPA